MKQLICGSLIGMRIRQSLPYAWQECGSPGRGSGWELEFSNCGAIPVRGLLLTVERQIEGMWGRRSLWEMPVEESQAAMEARQYCWVMCRGWSHHHSLSLSTGQHRSWTTVWLAHQTPDALNYRGGPNPGAPLSAWCIKQQRRTPGKDPSKCLNWQSYRETLAKEAFWLPATRGSNKDSDRAITPAAEAVCVPAHLELPGSPQAKQLHHLHTPLSLGQSCHRQKKSPVFMHEGSLRSCLTVTL